MRIFLLILILFWSTTIVVSQRDSLSPNAKISILTGGPGAEIYTLFGHSSLLIQDVQYGKEIIYDFGTFDFGKPNFEINFLKGRLIYALSTGNNLGLYLRNYDYDRRSLHEQELNLSHEQKNKIYHALQQNALPENREYLYDFYFDNCSTRLRDLLINYVESLSLPKENQVQKTFRDLLHENLQEVPWTRFGMDLILGQLSDRPTSVSEQMFLPQHLMKHIDESMIRDQSLVLEKRALNIHTQPKIAEPIITPFTLFLILLILEVFLFIMHYYSSTSRTLQMWDRMWFIILAICFAIFLFMWIATDHYVCANNWNMLWTVPWIALIPIGSNRSWRKIAIGAALLVCAFVLLFSVLIPQHLPATVLLICGISTIKLLRLMGAKIWIDKVVYNL